MHVATKVRIAKTDTLIAIEQKLSPLGGPEDGSVQIEIPNDYGSQFFKETWIVAAIATAYRWMVTAAGYEPGSAPSDQSRLPETLVDLARWFYDRADMKQDAHRVIAKQLQPLELRGGILETHGTGKALSVCAVDPFFPKPFALGVGPGSASFVDDFSALQRKYFEVGNAAGFSERFPHSNRSIGEFVYELFQNTLSHGRLDEADRVLPGLRYIRLKRHITHKRAEFMERANGFNELQRYFENTVVASGTFTLLEICVADAGIGIVDRFLATRPEMRDQMLAADTKSRVALVNHIINRRLSSKKNVPGAGGGLTNMINAARRLKGFLSVRSGREWAWSDFSAGSGVDVGLSDVQTPVELPRIAGTHYNLLVAASQ